MAMLRAQEERFPNPSIHTASCSSSGAQAATTPLLQSSNHKHDWEQEENTVRHFNRCQALVFKQLSNLRTRVPTAVHERDVVRAPKPGESRHVENQHATGFQDTTDFADRRFVVRNMLHSVERDDGVEHAFLERQLRGVALHQFAQQNPSASGLRSTPKAIPCELSSLRTAPVPQPTSRTLPLFQA